MSIEWDRLQVPSPRDSMHSETLLTLSRQELALSDRNANPRFEVAAWLKLRNAEQLPAILLLEYKDSKSERWHMVDTARVRQDNGTLLLSGQIELQVKKLQQLNFYLCHPNPALSIEVEELRINNRLFRKDYLDAYNVA